jgi:hypothetical protein
MFLRGCSIIQMIFNIFLFKLKINNLINLEMERKRVLREVIESGKDVDEIVMSLREQEEPKKKEEPSAIDKDIAEMVDYAIKAEESDDEEETGDKFIEGCASKMKEQFKAKMEEKKKKKK